MMAAIALASLLSTALGNPLQALNDGLARTPQMGFVLL
jgi:hypothetical protein